MSITFGKGDVLFEQRLLACGGFYTDKLDGKWGPNSEKAAASAKAKFEKLKAELGTFDSRSEGNIETLLPAMQAKTRLILAAAQKRQKTTGLICRVLSGTRTYAEQNALYNQRPVVTRARGGYSNHNFGIAIDLGLFTVAGKYLTGATAAEEREYARLAQEIKAAVPGVEWGGDWKSFKDSPHYQLDVGGISITKVRTLFEAGRLTRS